MQVQPQRRSRKQVPQRGRQLMAQTKLQKPQKTVQLQTTGKRTIRELPIINTGRLNSDGVTAVLAIWQKLPSPSAAYLQVTRMDSMRLSVILIPHRADLRLHRAME